ncbi:MAG: tetratricopeptide repeat protein [Trueperaceae bacterium]|nr:tetratricopeptide repeat protein [Trueperaceae bacterium]
MPRFRLVLCLCCLCLVSVFGLGAAQSVTTARDVLARAQQLADDARVRYRDSDSFSIDQELWREAIAVGERGLELDPNDPDILRFLAETHTSIDWHIRAWDYWLRYLNAGGSLDREARAQLAGVGAELGYARYQAGDLAGALGYYERLYDLNPDDTDALRWIGRIYFERGEPATALPYWREAAARDAEGADYYLRRTEQQIAVGVNASDTFHQGIAAYHAGELEAALGHFERATRYNDSFAEAFAWTGRVNLELSRPAAAVSAWQQVVALTPSDDGARYFLDVAEAQCDWGVDAATAFYDGLSRYNEGRIAEASERFAEAAQANLQLYDIVSSA